MLSWWELNNEEICFVKRKYIGNPTFVEMNYYKEISDKFKYFACEIDCINCVLI